MSRKTVPPGRPPYAWSTLWNTKGSDNPNAKIGEAEVYEIRRLYDAKDMDGLRQLCEEVGIRLNYACKVGRRQSWRHLP